MSEQTKSEEPEKTEETEGSRAHRFARGTYEHLGSLLSSLGEEYEHAVNEVERLKAKYEAMESRFKAQFGVLRESIGRAIGGCLETVLKDKGRDGILVVGPEGEIAYAGVEAGKLLGGAVIGERMIDFFRGGALRKYFENLICHPTPKQRENPQALVHNIPNESDGCGGVFITEVTDWGFAEGEGFKIRTYTVIKIRRLNRKSRKDKFLGQQLVGLVRNFDSEVEGLGLSTEDSEAKSA